MVLLKIFRITVFLTLLMNVRYNVSEKKEMTSMVFEIYKPRGEKTEKVPTVSFSKSSIVLNSIAREKLNSQQVELSYDNETKMVRIRAIENGGMQIKKTKVFGKGFFKYFGINPLGKCEARYDEQERALYININNILN